MKEKHPRHFEACSSGGKKSASKPYYCERCDKVGRGHKMVKAHLANNCEGVASRTLIKSDPHNRHLLEEARVNTQEWHAKKQLEFEKQMLRQMKRNMISSLEELRQINNQVMHEQLTKAFQNPKKKN